MEQAVSLRVTDGPRQSLRLSFPCQREVKKETGGGRAETSTTEFGIASLERRRRAEPTFWFHPVALEATGCLWHAGQSNEGREKAARGGTPRVPLCIRHPDLTLSVTLWRSRHLSDRLDPDCCGCRLSESTLGPHRRGLDDPCCRELVPCAHDVDVLNLLFEFFKGKCVPCNTCLFSSE